MSQDQGRLSQEEALQLAHLLHRHCETGLDQFDHWVVGTSYGDVYVDISRKLPPGHSPDRYIRIPSPGDVSQRDY